jgi:hypothetical protein
MGLYGYAVSGSVDRFDSFTVSAVGNPPPNSTITGAVSDAVTGAPVAGVTVSTLPVTTTATSDSQGHYALTLPAGTYTVVLTAFGVGYNSNDVTNVQAPANGTATAPTVRLVGIPSQTAMDTFTQPDRTQGWGTSTDGHSWSSDLGSYPGAMAGITSQQAWIDTQSSTSTDFDTWMGNQIQDQQVSVDFDMTSVLVDPNFQHGVRLLARVQNSTTWVLMSVNPTAGDLELWVVLNNNWTFLGSASVPISTNGWYHAKLDVVGTGVQGKAWGFGTTEPGWQVSATQKVVTGSGQAGVRATGAYVDVANFAQTPGT